METHLQELNDKRGNIFSTMRTQGYSKGSKRGRYRRGTTASFHLWGWMGQSVILQTHTLTLLWARHCADSYCSASLVTFEFSLALFSLSLLLVFSDFFLCVEITQTNSPYPHVSVCFLLSACRSMKFLSLNSKPKKRIQGADLVILLQSFSWGGPGPSHLFLWPLSKDERNCLCKGNTGSLSK